MHEMRPRIVPANFPLQRGLPSIYLHHTRPRHGLVREFHPLVGEDRYSLADTGKLPREHRLCSHVGRPSILVRFCNGRAWSPPVSGVVLLVCEQRSVRVVTTYFGIDAIPVRLYEHSLGGKT